MLIYGKELQQLNEAEKELLSLDLHYILGRMSEEAHEELRNELFITGKLPCDTEDAYSFEKNADNIFLALVVLPSIKMAEKIHRFATQRAKQEPFFQICLN